MENVRGHLRRYVGWYIGAIIVVALFVIAFWFVVGYWKDSWHVLGRWWWQDLVKRQLYPNGWNITHPGMLLTVTGFIVFGLITIGSISYQMDYETKAKGKWLVVIPLVISIINLGLSINGFVVNDKDEARSYASSTQFVVDDPSNVPSSLSPLASGGSPDSQGCAILGGADVYGCIVQGELPTTWEARSASAAGAKLVMKRTSDAVSNTQLMTDTMTYLYDNDGGTWTAVRNGINRQPLYGIVSWDGSNTSPKTCDFKGNNEIKYAFDGNWGQNLDDEIAKQYSNLMYAEDDIWGYCNGDTPTIVISVMTYEGYAFRTTGRPAGVLVITGSPSGEPVIKHLTSVKPGVLPGPVYPLAILQKQKEASMWAAGRANKNRLEFGYEETDVPSQAGNTGDYLLKSKVDGRLYWVTPLKPRSTDSQTIVAYSITSADEVESSKLNTQSIYVLNDGDPRVANIDDMEARVKAEIQKSDPGFFSSGGEIVEFLPLGGGKWQAFAQLNGRVLYRVDIDASAKIKPTVYKVNEGETSPTSEQPSETTDFCAQDPSTLTTDQLQQCAQAYLDELANRAKGNGK